MTTQDKLKKLEENVMKFEQSTFDLDSFTSLVDETEKDNYSVIKDVIANNIPPKDEINQKVNIAQRTVRKVGNRFLNLFKITFTVEFAGTTLIHWTIPRIDENGNTFNR